MWPRGLPICWCMRNALRSPLVVVGDEAAGVMRLALLGDAGFFPCSTRCNDPGR